MWAFVTLCRTGPLLCDHLMVQVIQAAQRMYCEAQTTRRLKLEDSSNQPAWCLGEAEGELCTDGRRGSLGMFSGMIFNLVLDTNKGRTTLRMILPTRGLECRYSSFWLELEAASDAGFQEEYDN